jgi:hypothetical protein
MKKITQLISTIIDNIRQPKYRLVYRKKINEVGCYILLNPTHLLGNGKVTYSNPHWRKEFGLESVKGFRCVTTKGIRSFDYEGIVHLSRIGLMEVVK